MSAEVWAAVVVILGVIAEALRRAWMKADEQKRKQESDRAAADERRARAVRDRDAGGLFNGS
jgi:hypothetical protein